MGFLDKVKESANELSKQANELAGKVSEKVDETQAKRKADDLLEELGRVVFAQRTSRGSDLAEAEADRLIGELSTLESEGVAVLPRPPAPPAAPMAPAPPAPPAPPVPPAPPAPPAG